MTMMMMPMTTRAARSVGRVGGIDFQCHDQRRHIGDLLQESSSGSFVCHLEYFPDLLLKKLEFKQLFDDPPNVRRRNGNVHFKFIGKTARDLRH